MAPRCDRCPAPALTLWALLETDLDERDLEMCGPHATEHEDALVMAGWVLVGDEREVAAHG